jgi:hypothetical protein
MPIVKKNRSIQKLVKFLGLCMGWIGFAGLLLWFGLSNHEVSTFPRLANPSIGSVFPRSINGIVIYETLSEKALYDRIEYGSFVIFGTGFALLLIYKQMWGKEPRVSPPMIGNVWRPK